MKPKTRCREAFNVAAVYKGNGGFHMATQDKTTKVAKATNGKATTKSAIRFDNPGGNDSLDGFEKAGTAKAAMPRPGLIAWHNDFEMMGVIREVRGLFSEVVDEDGHIVPWMHADMHTPRRGSALDGACGSSADYKAAIDPAHLFALKIKAEIAVFMAQARRDFPSEGKALEAWEKDMEDAFAQMDSDALVNLSTWYMDRHVVDAIRKTAAA
jgi:hypothetical protein